MVKMVMSKMMVVLVTTRSKAQHWKRREEGKINGDKPEGEGIR
jgi:hypothetical protein